MELATSPEQHQFCTVYARRWIYGRIHFHAVVAVGAVDGSHTPPVWHILGWLCGHGEWRPSEWIPLSIPAAPSPGHAHVAGIRLTAVNQLGVPVIVSGSGRG